MDLQAPLAVMFVNQKRPQQRGRFQKSHQWDTNPRPDDYESSALPAELWWRTADAIIQERSQTRKFFILRIV